jgi:hypothetical protein
MHNKKINIYRSGFSCIDAKAFADAANESIRKWQHPLGFFWQADEIWHENLLRLTMKAISSGKQELCFWRYQLRTNFQTLKWSPHPVHRYGRKDSFVFTGDGMNTDTVFGHDVVSNYNMGWFTKWGEDYKDKPTELPTHEMILDVSKVGGFRDNIPNKCQLHAPMWHESISVEGQTLNDWSRQAQANPDWEKPFSPFDIPHIMKWHVGKTHYEVRNDLLESIRTNTTEKYLGI